jgi:hypothetical protein
MVYIKSDEEVIETKLIDGIGNIIKHQTIDAYKMNVSEFSSGVYFIE